MTGSPVVDFLFLALIAASVTYYIALTSLTRALRTRHPDIWTSLGEPSLLNYSIRNSNRMGIWVLFRSDFKSLKDPAVSKTILLLRAIALLQISLLLPILIWRFA